MRLARQEDLKAHLIGLHQIDAFESVDFAALRPDGRLRPRRRPDGAAVRHVHEIKNPERADRVLQGDKVSGTVRRKTGMRTVSCD